MLQLIIQFLKNNIFVRPILIYLIWIFIYWGSANLYPRICAPFTIYGFILSPFLVVTPQCQAMRLVLQTGASNITGMFILLGTWLVQKIVIV